MSLQSDQLSSPLWLLMLTGIVIGAVAISASRSRNGKKDNSSDS
jgi:hypothetical protein